MPLLWLGSLRLVLARGRSSIIQPRCRSILDKSWKTVPECVGASRCIMKGKVLFLPTQLFEAEEHR
jgi:hypothetical protein